MAETMDLLMRTLKAISDDRAEAGSMASTAGASCPPRLMRDPQAGYYWECPTPKGLVIFRTSELSKINDAALSEGANEKGAG